MDMHKRISQFKFNNFWVQRPEFMETISNAWISNIRGTPQFKVCKKLKQIKEGLKAVSRGAIGDIPHCIKLARDSLHSTKQHILFCSTAALRSAEQSKHAELIQLLNLEESLLHQKSRVAWLCKGDSNTSFSTTR